MCGWASEGSTYERDACRTALLAHKRSHKGLGRIKSSAAEASRSYPTAAAAAADDNHTDASLNTRVATEGGSLDAAAGYGCSSNGKTGANNHCHDNISTSNGSVNNSSTSKSSSRSLMGPLNVVRTAEEGDILRAPGLRASPCPHFVEGCGGCQFMHLALLHQRTAKKQLVLQMVQELQQHQQLHQQQSPQLQHTHREPPTIVPFVPTSSETQFAARADMLLQLVEGRPRLGLPAFDGSTSILSIQDCIRLRGPLREVYRHLREVLLPLLESRRLRVLDHRCGAGTLSGLTLRLAEGCEGGGSKVLLRLKGRLESNVRPRLLDLAEALSKRSPALKAVTFYDVGRPHSPDEVILGADALVVSVFGRRFRITGGTREAIMGCGDSLEQLWPAVEKAAGSATGRLWGAFGSAGLFEILLSFRFKEVLVFAAGARDVEETRKNISLNGLDWCVAGAFAARSGFYGPLGELHRSFQLQQGKAEETSTKRLRNENRAFEGGASTDDKTIATGALHLPDVLLLSPSRGGLPKASSKGSSDGPGDVRRWVAAADISRVVYIAHDQPSFLRDAKGFVAAGYELAYFEAFDLSPHRADVLSVSAFFKRHLGLPQAGSLQKRLLTIGPSRQES
ncbi:RNA methyltransferase, TrmA family, putative [Eimeria praecox]|uniref:RNA methyltransferase, TrmA family, putative n=1 Tax=Eimeria praecox TaxID=51316 RepID=U6GPS1_9EIME|nr:RNA methyltransferase, TrmA family, putative [Eimeria praecox]